MVKCVLYVSHAVVSPRVDSYIITSVLCKNKGVYIHSLHFIAFMNCVVTSPLLRSTKCTKHFETAEQGCWLIKLPTD